MHEALATQVPVAQAEPIETAEQIDRTMSGEVSLLKFEVLSGDKVTATSNLKVISAQEAVIDGMIDALAGVSIHIVAPKIHVKGSIRTIKGTSTLTVEGNGGDGGNIVLSAPVIVLQGAQLRSGNGGDAGPSGNGGNGGDIIIDVCEEFITIGRVSITAGDGGEPGAGIDGYGPDAMNGGNGGHGGTVDIDCGDDPPPGDPPPGCTVATGSTGTNQPANPEFKPIIVKDCKIQGVVTGVLRRY